MILPIITDTHFGARNDSLPLQQSQKKFLEQVFFPTLDAHACSAVIHLGDYFDRRKYVNYQTANFVEAHYRQPLRQRNIREYVIPGNHDTYYRHSTELNSVQELYRHDASMQFYAQPAEITIGGVDILLLPWVTDNNRDETMRLIRETKCQIVMGHLEIKGFQMHRGIPSATGFQPSLFDRFDLVLSGHYHHKSHKDPIHYLGAPWPMIWSDYNDDRGFHLFNTETRELTFIPNPYSLFMRLVYDDAGQKHSYIKQLCQQILQPDSPYQDAYVKVVVKSKTQPYWFDMMIDALYKVNAQDVLVIDDVIVHDEDDEPDESKTELDTLVLMREYVDSLSISCDRDELFEYLRNKYQDALASSQSARL